ncbi:MAG: heme-binding protein [Caulobacteraceae bacterium]
MATTPPPPGSGYGAPLGLEQAKRVVAAAEAEAKRLSLYATIVVVEPSGDIVLAQKMDNSPFGGFDSARRKARAAALLRRPSGAPGAPPPTAAAALARPALGSTPGGEPIIIGGRIVGAIGVSAGVLQEEQVAKAGAAAIR